MAVQPENGGPGKHSGGGTMDRLDVEKYLHVQIPLSWAMAVEVQAATPTCVRLSAPLAPNINHRETVFGGSASAVAILAAWTLLYVRLESEKITARVVIQKNTMHYEAPITDAFVAEATIRQAEAWTKFIVTLQRRRRARIVVSVVSALQRRRSWRTGR
jgi:thioesterase domain-containing protein